MIMTSPCWTRTCQPHHRVTSRRQVSSRVRFGFSRQPCTETAISLTSGIQMRRSSKRWNRDDDKLLFDLVQAPYDSWIMLCDHESCCITCFGPKWLCIVLGLKPKLGAPLPGHASTIGCPRLYLFSSRRHFRLGFCLV